MALIALATHLTKKGHWHCQMDHFWGACEFSWKCESCQYYSKFRMINFLECFPGRWRSSLDVFSRLNVARLCFRVSGKSTKGVINCFFYIVLSIVWKKGLNHVNWAACLAINYECGWRGKSGQASLGWSWREKPPYGWRTLDHRGHQSPRYQLFTQNSGTKVIESAKVLGR